jgi:hypothetical protein
MRVYRVKRDADDEQPYYAGTFRKGLDLMKTVQMYPYARMQLIEFDLSKATVIDILNCTDFVHKVLKTWAAGPRGGAVEYTED